MQGRQAACTWIQYHASVQKILDDSHVATYDSKMQDRQVVYPIGIELVLRQEPASGSPISHGACSEEVNLYSRTNELPKEMPVTQMAGGLQGGLAPA